MFDSGNAFSEPLTGAGNPQFKLAARWRRMQRQPERDGDPGRQDGDDIAELGSGVTVWLRRLSIY